MTHTLQLTESYCNTHLENINLQSWIPVATSFNIQIVYHNYGLSCAYLLPVSKAVFIASLYLFTYMALNFASCIGLC